MCEISGTVLRTTTTTTSSSPTTTSLSEEKPTTPSLGALTPHIVTTVANSMPKTTRQPQTVKLKVGDSPMKVYPVGARILPKTAPTGSTPGGSPVFMVATSMSQNLMRVAGRTTSQTVTLTSGQRVVTVNTASLRPSVKQLQGSAATPTTIKAVQPRVVTSGQHTKVATLPASISGPKLDSQ